MQFDHALTEDHVAWLMDMFVGKQDDRYVLEHLGGNKYRLVTNQVEA